VKNYNFFRLIFDRNSKKMKLNRNIYIFFFCLLLSSFFWLLAALSKSYTTSFEVALEYSSIHPKKVFVDPPPSKLMLQVRGSGFDLIGEQLNLNRSPVKLDLNQAIAVGKNRYMIPMRHLSLEIEEQIGRELSLEEIQLDSLNYQTADRLEKRLAVKANTKLTFKAAYQQSGKIIIQPESVSVFGSESELNELSEVFTEPIQASKLSESLNLNAQLVVPSDNSSIRIQPAQVKLYIPVEKFTEKEIFVEVEAVSLDSSLTIKTFPNQIKVLFSVPLSNYDHLNNRLLQAKVFYTPESAEQNKLSVELLGVPDYAKVKRMEPEKVEYIVLN